MSRILVCGGAGYVGSHMVKLLLEQGSEVTVFDNLSTGHRAAVSGAELVVGDIRDRAALSSLFKRRSFPAAIRPPRPGDPRIGG